MQNTSDLFIMLAGTFLLVTLLAFSIGFLINWYRNRTVIASYKRIGFFAALIVAVYELLTLALSASSLYYLGASFVPIVLAVGWLMLRIWAFTNNGIFYSNKLGLRSFPLIAPRLRLPPAAASPTTAVDPVTGPLATQPPLEGDAPIGSESMPPQPIEPALALFEPIATAATPADPIEVSLAPVAATAPTTGINWRNYWLTILAVGLGAVLYSAILFTLTLPSIGDIFREAVGNGPSITPLSLVLILEIAFNEEIFFRLGVQNFLAARLVNRRRGYEIAIVITTILWTLGHAGALNPDWIKFAQVFPIGLALGWLYRRYGTESAIIAHSLFNLVSALLLSPLLFR
jgi:hypothetical protein